MAPAKKRGRKSTGSHRINEGASTSNGVSTPYEKLAFENAQFSRECPRIWIQCEKCKKWRQSDRYFERREVPDDWQCTMWTTEDGQRGSCDVPGSTDDSEIEHEPFPEGEIVWAKLGKYHFWPSMIESDPVDLLSTIETKNGSKQYNVTFFGSQPLRQWVPASNVRKYEKSDPAAFPGKRLRLAIEQGNEALDTPFTIRIEKYSLATLRAKKWRTKKCRRTTRLNGHAENGYCDASEANAEKEPTTDGQQASPDSVTSFDSLAHQMQQPMHQELPSPTDGRTEVVKEKQHVTVGMGSSPLSSPCRTSNSRINSTDNEYDGGESSRSNRPLPSSSHLGSDDEEDYFSEEVLAYKAFLDRLYPCSITGSFRT